MLHHGIEKAPWVWDKPIEQYTRIDAFFCRTYAPKHAPPLSLQNLVSPSNGTVVAFSEIESMQRVWVKDKKFEIVKMPLNFSTNNIGQLLLFKLDTNDVHQFIAPTSCIIERIIKRTDTQSHIGRGSL